MANPQELYQAILEGDHKKSVEITQQAIAGAARPLDLISNYMIPAMDEVGRRFQCEDYFVPELLLSARAMKSALELLRPLLAASGAQPAGKIVIGTVKGDLHDIGKNLVASMLEGAGFEVIDLGADVAPERFIEAVKSTGANIVCLSALLTVTMPSMKKTIDALNDAGVRDRVKVLVGGAPVTAQFARDIGADAYGEDSTVAVSLARRFCGVAGVA
jgi:corrinoid protein of di/trimethylamine methyltransferase